MSKRNYIRSDDDRDPEKLWQHRVAVARLCTIGLGVLGGVAWFVARATG